MPDAIEVIRRLTPYAGPGSVGTAFGGGVDLNEAMHTISVGLTMEDVRSIGSTLAVTIITDDAIDPDRLLGVMGIEHLDGDSPVVQLAGAAFTFLGQFDTPGANIWELWLRNDDVALEFLCWHAVAYLRLEAIGDVVVGSV